MEGFGKVERWSNTKFEVNSTHKQTRRSQWFGPRKMRNVCWFWCHSIRVPRMEVEAVSIVLERGYNFMD